MALGVLDAVMDGLSAADRPTVAKAFARKYAAEVAHDGAPALTTVEWRVMRLTAEGMTSIQIGNRIGCHQRTVEQRLDAIRKKMDAVNRVDMVVKAMRWGML